MSADSTNELIIHALKQLQDSHLQMHAQNRMDIGEFRQVLDETKQEVTETRVKVQDLAGNGKPGRVHFLEHRVSNLYRYLYIGTGVIISCQVILALIEMYVHLMGYMRGHP